MKSHELPLLLRICKILLPKLRFPEFGRRFHLSVYFGAHYWRGNKLNYQSERGTPFEFWRLITSNVCSMVKTQADPLVTYLTVRRSFFQNLLNRPPFLWSLGLPMVRMRQLKTTPHLRKTLIFRCRFIEKSLAGNFPYTRSTLYTSKFPPLIKGLVIPRKSEGTCFVCSVIIFHR